MGGTLDCVVVSTSGIALAMDTALVARRPTPSTEVALRTHQPRAVDGEADGRGARAPLEVVTIPVSTLTSVEWVRVLSPWEVGPITTRRS